MSNLSISYRRATSLLINLGLILVMVGTMMPFFLNSLQTFHFLGYVYGAGAMVNLVGRLMALRGIGELPDRLRRLRRLEVFSALFFIAACCCLLFPDWGRSNWVALTMAGAAVVIYTSVIGPRIAIKNQKKDK